jgi:hypothetical protein
VPSLILFINAPYSFGVAYPTVSGMLIVVAPASITCSNNSHKNGTSLLKHLQLRIQHFPHSFLHVLTAFTAASITACGSIYNLYFI